MLGKRPRLPLASSSSSSSSSVPRQTIVGFDLETNPNSNNISHTHNGGELEEEDEAEEEEEEEESDPELHSTHGELAASACGCSHGFLLKNPSHDQLCPHHTHLLNDGNDAVKHTSTHHNANTQHVHGLSTVVQHVNNGNCESPRSVLQTSAHALVIISNVSVLVSGGHISVNPSSASSNMMGMGMGLMRTDSLFSGKRSDGICILHQAKYKDDGEAGEGADHSSTSVLVPSNMVRMLGGVVSKDMLSNGDQDGGDGDGGIVDLVDDDSGKVDADHGDISGNVVGDFHDIGPTPNDVRILPMMRTFDHCGYKSPTKNKIMNLMKPANLQSRPTIFSASSPPNTIHSSSSSSSFSCKPSGTTTTALSMEFLHQCCFCASPLHGKDIFMYRGDQGFCSADCRYKQMVIDDEEEEGKRAGQCDRISVDGHVLHA